MWACTGGRTRSRSSWLQGQQSIHCAVFLSCPLCPQHERYKWVCNSDSCSKKSPSAREWWTCLFPVSPSLHSIYFDYLCPVDLYKRTSWCLIDIPPAGMQHFHVVIDLFSFENCLCISVDPLSFGLIEHATINLGVRFLFKMCFAKIFSWSLGFLVTI